MNKKHYIGQRLSNFELLDEVGPVTGVSIFLDDENEIFVGSDSGYVLEIECPYGTDQMARSIFSEVEGKVYKAYQGLDAILSPEAELGDGITVNGVYSVLADRDITFGPAHISDVSAPGESTLQHEYPYIGSTEKKMNRKVAQTRSYIEKTAEEINLVVEGLQDKFTKVSVTLDGLTVTDPTGTTLINGSLIETTNLHVKAANIDGTLKADQIVLTGSISWGDLDSGVQNSINSAGGISEAEATTLITRTLVSSPTIRGGTFGDLGGQNYITMYTEEDQYGYNSFLNHYSSIYSTSLPLMSMGYRNLGYGTDQWLMQVRNRTVMQMGVDDTLHLWGVWDFSGATVTGLSVVFG